MQRRVGARWSWGVSNSSWRHRGWWHRAKTQPLRSLYNWLGRNWDGGIAHPSHNHAFLLFFSFSQHWRFSARLFPLEWLRHWCLRPRHHSHPVHSRLFNMTILILKVLHAIPSPRLFVNALPQLRAPDALVIRKGLAASLGVAIMDEAIPDGEQRIEHLAIARAAVLLVLWHLEPTAMHQDVRKREFGLVVHAGAGARACHGAGDGDDAACPAVMRRHGECDDGAVHELLYHRCILSRRTRRCAR